MESSFDGVLAFAFLGCMLLAGTVLRARVAAIRNALVPASLVGGLLGFALLAFGLGNGYQSSDFAPFTFHFFTLSFMSLVLTGTEKQAPRSVAWGGSWLSVLWVMSLVLQALTGLIVIAGYNMATDGGLSHFLGVIVTHGFTQGPGQALALGSIWENELGVTHAVNFGLIYASVGFIVAFGIGVPVARWGVSRGLNANRSARIDEEFASGILSEDTRLTAGNQITHPANVDSLGFHLAILGIAYLLTDAYLDVMQPLVALVDLNDVNLSLIFSHNLFFFHGLIICVILRAAMDRLGLGRYIDNDTQRRITGTAVDFMVIATIMSIEFALLSAYLVPIVMVCLSVSVVTALLCFGFGRQLRDHGIERSLTAFGCCCGSTGSGLLLLRMLDPNLSTPIARELAFFNIAILFLGFHILILMAPILPSFGFGTIITVYVATFIVGAGAIVVVARRLNRDPLTADVPE
ncbi:MAG: sodium/glutamate symporter [Pseudomonadales bacterium]|jgi:ESS family glutamate:Na+ symporter|nr:sodium/glutamate symporter [Pseudomonadales bacterium]MDP6472359.1 sodium/glutamate symporter [Pseudomonadales bacterium]MDP6828155.1 sodium/glutamate symporter [Pseudomonadales bacterium]MDP6973460.1 sodium/glutamate symporter [Pseudomonadales bacterium]